MQSFEEKKCTKGRSQQEENQLTICKCLDLSARCTFPSFADPDNQVVVSPFSEATSEEATTFSSYFSDSAFLTSFGPWLSMDDMLAPGMWRGRDVEPAAEVKILVADKDTLGNLHSKNSVCLRRVRSLKNRSLKWSREQTKRTVLIPLPLTYSAPAGENSEAGVSRIGQYWFTLILARQINPSSRSARTLGK